MFSLVFLASLILSAPTSYGKATSKWASRAEYQAAKRVEMKAAKREHRAYNERNLKTKAERTEILRQKEAEAAELIRQKEAEQAELDRQWRAQFEDPLTQRKWEHHAQAMWQIAQDEAEAEAATKIQSRFRGNQGRKAAEEQRAEKEIIEAFAKYEQKFAEYEKDTEMLLAELENLRTATPSPAPSDDATSIFSETTSAEASDTDSSDFIIFMFEPEECQCQISAKNKKKQANKSQRKK